MKPAIAIASIGALLAAIATIATGQFYYGPGCIVAEGLGMTACVLSAIHAGRNQHPGWSALLALVSVAGIVSLCNQEVMLLSYIDSPAPPGFQTPYAIGAYVRQVALPVAALLSLLLGERPLPLPAATSTPADPPVSVP